MICEARGCGCLATQQSERVDQNSSSHDLREILNAQRTIFGPRGGKHQRVRSGCTGERVGAPRCKRHNRARDYRIMNADADPHGFQQF